MIDPSRLQAPVRVVLDELSVAPAEGFASDAWYHNRYLPQLRASGAFGRIRSYVRPAASAYLAVCELRAGVDWSALDALSPAAGPGVATHARHRTVQTSWGAAPGVDAQRLDTPFLYPVFFDVPAERADEFDRWYDEEHLPILLRSPHWPACRRLRREGGERGPWTHIALHSLSDLRALESPERDAARATPWRDRLATEPWFRGTYRVYYRVGAAAA